MSKQESDAIESAGLKRVVVYQNKHNSYEKFSASIAKGDASRAISLAKSLGQPSGTIYFAVDYDATEKQINENITQHFKTIKAMLSEAGYATGVYGSGLVCKILKESSLVSKTWLANATAWGFGTKFSDLNIKQTGALTIGGISFDGDTASSLDAIGGW